jgi:hypothetical protein
VVRTSGVKTASVLIWKVDLDSFYTILVQTNFIHNINPNAFWGSSKGLMSFIYHSKGISLLGLCITMHYE